MSFAIINTLVHVIGFYLLVSLYCYSARPRTTQQILLINLSLSIVIKSLISIIGSVSAYLFLIYSDDQRWNRICYYVRLAESTGGLYQYYFSIGYITLDRLLTIVLKTRYAAICTTRRTIKVLAGTWLLDLCLYAAVVMGAVTTQQLDLFHDWIDIYLPSIFDLLFFTFTVSSYVIIFLQFASSQRRVAMFGTQRVKESLFTIFRKTKFYVSVLLVLSSLVLTTIPGLIISYLRITKTEFPIILVYYVISSFGFSYFVDGAIYIFMQYKVRRHLFLICTCRGGLSELKRQNRNTSKMSKMSNQFAKGLKSRLSGDL